MSHETKGHQDVVKKLGELIKDIRVAMMTTVHDKGELRSRPMWTYEGAFEGQLWFFTKEHTTKVDEIQKDFHVNLAYADPGKNSFVSVVGKAVVLNDRAKAKELWNPGLKAWFPEGLEDPELRLLRVDVEKAEYWDAPNSKFVQLVGFVQSQLTGKPANLGENEKVVLHPKH